MPGARHLQMCAIPVETGIEAQRRDIEELIHVHAS
jgi:hypothetical protein